MKDILKNKKNRYIFILVVVFLVISFIIYGRFASADTAANKVAIRSVKMTKITTGTSTFDSSDGLNYSDTNSYSVIEGYTAGNDNNADNRIVRSFDELSYNFKYSIMGKDGVTDYEDRTVSIKVTIPDSVAKYVSFDKNAEANETSHTYTFTGVDTYGEFNSTITLYVLGAPNGTKISPKFEVQESTNTDSNYLISLGNVSDSATNYEYDSDKTNKYSTVSNTPGFRNYMPTVVSSKEADYNVNLVEQTNEGQKSIYKDNTGRYLTYVFGIEIVGDNTKGLKGVTMPDGSDISFNVSASQNGSNKSVFMEDSWLRLYGPNSVSGIESVTSANPYSTNSSGSKLINIPGQIKLTKVSDSNYSVLASDYKITYAKATLNADGTSISNKSHYIATYAATVFSPRTSEDGKNDINTTLNIKNLKIRDTNGSEITLANFEANAVNKYYEIIDYSLQGEYYDQANNKISTDGNGKGAVSKGETVVYKTTFNYKKTMSDQGLKEVIKVDPNAYRVIQNGDKDIKITVEGAGDKKLSQDDFEVLYISGDFNNSNYTAVTDAKVSAEDLSTVQTACNTVKQNINTYSNDQIMNLYGGPCIKANDNFEQIFEKISDAKDKDNKEIPITKIVVQTKKGIILPDSAKVIVEINLRVRNVSDLTQTYQTVVMAKSSDYDSNVTYYSPRITNDSNSITNPNNYNKTIYKGSNISSIDSDSPWGDSLKIVNFTSREDVTVTNKEKDGSVKINYNVSNGETINYNVKTTITDLNENVGADDVWYINSLKIYVTIPNGLTYVPDKKLGEPTIASDNNNTYLTYVLPYTKPNMEIPEINFKATLSPTLVGTGIPLTVTSTVEAININGEKDTSYFNYLTGSFTIYANGENKVILTQKHDNNGSKVEKNSEFGYVLNMYNNTTGDINNYAILDKLPSNGDKNGSKFNGTYKVKLEMPSSLGTAKIYCSTQTSNLIEEEVNNKNNELEECNIANEFMDVTAIKITDINLKQGSYSDDIKVIIKPENNSYSDKYINSFVGYNSSLGNVSSNKLETSVISRSISGRVFMDNNENGIEDSSDTYYKDMSITLYKVDQDENLSKVDTTLTDENGKYVFKDLEKGNYKIRADYDSSAYDLTLRYATEDKTKDSDGYKVGDNIIEIGIDRNNMGYPGIRLDQKTEEVSDLNIGLIPIKSFGFEIKKYITKVDLNNNGVFNSYTYDNQTKVMLSVRNSLYASARVYYGIEITNNSTSAGYVKLISEDIPQNTVFNTDDSINKDWFYSDGTLKSVALENDLISPGEKRYLTIVLDVPASEYGRSYINTVSLLEVEKYEPNKEIEDTNADSNSYKVGEAVRYAGIDFHVINTENKDGEQILTLLADSGTISTKMGHTSSANDIYKWSNSKINKYINGDFVNQNSLNLPILVDNSVCDDASGLQAASYGGTIASEGKCMSNKYGSYKVRLLTETEYNKLKTNNSSDLSWLYGSNDFWLMNSVFMTQEKDVYGNIIDTTNVKNLAKYVSKSSTSIQNGYNSSKNKWVTANTAKEVRPVITISNKNIIPE